MTGIIIRIYRFLLGLYPAAFRSEFREQMLLDFADMAADASKKGKLSFVGFCLRELVDFPINLLHAHVDVNRMFRILRSPPVSVGLRSALGFGVAFGLANMISMFVPEIVIPHNVFIEWLQAHYCQLYDANCLSELISWIPSGISSLLTGLLLGIVFALLFADRPKYPRYILAGMLGWFLHGSVRAILGYFNLGVFLGGNQGEIISYLTIVLSGAFLGLIFFTVNSERREPLYLLAASAFAYPFLTYLYTNLIFDIFIYDTPWRFVSLVGYIAVLVVSVFVVAIKSDSSEKKKLWVIVAGAAGLPALWYLAFWVGQLIFPSMSSWGILHGEYIFGSLDLTIAASNAILGVVFGLLMGLASGMLGKGNPQLAAD